MKKLIAIILLTSFSFTVSGEAQRYKHKNWVVTIDADQQASMLIAIEKSGEAKLPQLFIWCTNAWKESSKYKMGLLDTGVIDVVDPNQIDVMLSVDDSPKFNDGWFKERHILFTPISTTHIKNMIAGGELHIQFRDKHKLHKYTYPIPDLEELLKLMSGVCLYNFG